MTAQQRTNVSGRNTWQRASVWVARTLAISAIALSTIAVPKLAHAGQNSSYQGPHRSYYKAAKETAKARAPLMTRRQLDDAIRRSARKVRNPRDSMHHAKHAGRLKGYTKSRAQGRHR